MKFDPAYLAESFSFIQWGDERLLDAAANVPAPAYFQDRNISHGSLHRLLVHMMAAQWIWLGRFRGSAPLKMENDQDHPTLQSLQLRWSFVHREMNAFLAVQSVESLGKPLTYSDTKGVGHTLELGRFVQHVLDHGTYHRGQANTMLKLAGAKPLNLSLYPFFEAKR